MSYIDRQAALELVFKLDTERMRKLVSGYLQDLPEATFNVYLSGPMTGLPDHNYPNFKRTAGELRAKGWSVYNPAEFNDYDPDAWDEETAFADYERYLREEAHAIYLMPGWQQSKGAARELAWAREEKLIVIEEAMQ